jgi:outer membrane lipoprotein-sorting protein
MTYTATELARNAISAYETLKGFTATQKIIAGPIHSEARLRFKSPNKVTVEYKSYQNPLVDFEEELAGGAEFLADELIGMQLIHNGVETWLHDGKNDVAICKSGRVLYAPLPGTTVIAEFGFLAALTHDFLLRDEGEEEIEGRKAQRLGLKPKVSHRSSLLKEEVFPVEKASLALDAETFFPLRITYVPSHPSTLSYLLGPGTSITIEYLDVRLGEIDEKAFSFDPPEGTRVFREQIVPGEALNETLPFIVPLGKLEEEAELKLYGKQATVTINEAKDRAYALLAFAPSEDRDDEDSYALSLRVGNYLSLNMNRRRATLSEHGEKILLEGVSAHLFDRGKKLKEKIPQAPERSILEIGWEDGGVFWFILAENLERDRLVEIAEILARPGSKG